MAEEESDDDDNAKDEYDVMVLEDAVMGEPESVKKTAVEQIMFGSTSYVPTQTRAMPISSARHCNAVLDGKVMHMCNHLDNVCKNISSETCSVFMEIEHKTHNNNNDETQCVACGTTVSRSIMAMSSDDGVRVHLAFAHGMSSALSVADSKLNDISIRLCTLQQSCQTVKRDT